MKQSGNSVLNIERDLYWRVKAAAATARISIKEFVRVALEKELSKKAKGEKTA